MTGHHTGRIPRVRALAPDRDPETGLPIMDRRWQAVNRPRLRDRAVALFWDCLGELDNWVYWQFGKGNRP